MAKKKSKRNISKPVEKHETAAWADIEKVKPVTNVSMPNESSVRDAKDHVDSNEK
ncbi:MAG TPA: DUF3787 domain-containing protein [Clostridiaceae bacterium]|nr:DUF3787 domain-containing protein [Clostridiaceae bacterium]